jgi:hypothetical protein
MYDWGSYLGSHEWQMQRVSDEAKNERIRREKAAGTYVPECVFLRLTAAEANKLMAELAGRRGRLRTIRNKLKEAYANAR